MKILNDFNQFGTKSINFVKKHSPEILIGTGIVSGVATIITACIATTKINNILEEHKEIITELHNFHDGQTIKINEDDTTLDYPDKEFTKDLITTYAKTGARLAKLYAVPIIFGTVSITSILAGTKIIKGRNAALTAAYGILDSAFKRYRKNVTEEFGDEVDKRMRFSIKKIEAEDKNGEKKKKKVEKYEINPKTVTDYSDYARFFDASCAEWTKNPEYNLMFLKAQQAYLNDRLKARKHVFLNEVYDALGLERTSVGQIVGWIYDPDHPIGDNFIDFGIYDIDSERTRSFVNGFENVILLDFNVDGVIYDKI